ncbi:metallophosphoesterase family protein [Adhaeretor mobilis]|uniref:Calcineurin-like phosphoesterase domain-containing protein n=1 Tax=Adhaeretor mobilis TaxID=1930276 RepID=A0A517N004_9BACT|nr:metallophosphoesterase [Adhaeretor mobilis]QDT00378.1 hypothetical protein HG15A2_37140 [Adhaeretor mobilis]
MATTDRRNVLLGLGLSAATFACKIPGLRAGERSPNSEPGKLTLGLVADVHQDVIQDAHERLRMFIDQMKQDKPDAIIQLGDFAIPISNNQPFLDTWNSFDGPKYHVLGNHDTDGGYRKQQTMEWWGMPERYYSFDKHGFHIVVLDGNDSNPEPWEGYPRYIDAEQQDWLAQDIEGTGLPTLVICHQSLEAERGVDNRDQIRKILEAANAKAGHSKVFACLSGHHHIDYQKRSKASSISRSIACLIIGWEVHTSTRGSVLMLKRHFLTSNLPVPIAIHCSPP